MTERLQKLREQRDIILRHLQWLDQEIAREGPHPSPSGIGESTPAACELEESTTTTPAPAGGKPAAVLPDPMEDTHVRSLKNDVRKGCLLYFGIAWTILLALVGVIYLIYR